MATGAGLGLNPHSVWLALPMRQNCWVADPGPSCPVWARSWYHLKQYQSGAIKLTELFWSCEAVASSLLLMETCTAGPWGNTRWANVSVPRGRTSFIPRKKKKKSLCSVWMQLAWLFTSGTDARAVSLCRGRAASHPRETLIWTLCQVRC